MAPESLEEPVDLTRFEKPDDFKWGEFIAKASGAKIRYGSLQPNEDPPKGTIVLVPGFREPIEKYFEVLRDMTERGFAVWIMDWHGQGGSDRFFSEPNEQKMHSEGYDEHVETLHQFTQDIVKEPDSVKKSDGPAILMGASMGAAISMLFLSKYPDVFDSAVFTSPMCDIQTRGHPRSLVLALAWAAKVRHQLDKYVLGGHDWDERNEDFSTNKLTSSEKRFSVLARIYEGNPKLKMGDPTFGWLLNTFKFIRIYRNVDFGSIKIPILMGIAGDDEVVHASASVRAAKLMPRCERVDIPEAKHEIWMERNDLRVPWLGKVGNFLEKTLRQWRLSPKKPEGNTGRRLPQPGPSPCP